MDQTTDAAVIFGPLWRRKWLILLVGVLVAAGTYVYYKRKPLTFAATTQLYFGGAAEERPSEGGKTGVKGGEIKSQVALINSSILAESVRKALRKEHALAAMRGKAKAKAPSGSGGGGFVTIAAQAHSRLAAAKLANAYAQAYVNWRENSHRHGVEAAIATTRLELRRLEAAAVPPAAGGSNTGSSSGVSSAQIVGLHHRISELESQLSVTAVEQVGVARRATATLSWTSPKKEALFGFAIGVLLAAMAAYALSRFNRRLNLLGEAEEVFEKHILAALPAVRAPVVHPEGGPEPNAALREPLRRFHTVLQMGDVLEVVRGSDPPVRDRHVLRSILLISADPGDGRSALVAELALTQCEAGERVAVVEADFRRPAQAGLLGVHAPHGLAHVLTGRLAPEDAMVSCASPPEQAPRLLQGRAHAAGPVVARAGVATVPAPSGAGSVSVLLNGGPVANPPALLSGQAMRDTLRTLAGEYDHVLLDAPAPLQFSDAIPLLGMVDAIVIAVQLEWTRKTSAQRLVQLLEHVSTAPVLGIAVSRVSPADSRRHGFSVASARSFRLHRLLGR